MSSRLSSVVSSKFGDQIIKKKWKLQVKNEKLPGPYTYIYHVAGQKIVLYVSDLSHFVKIGRT